MRRSLVFWCSALICVGCGKGTPAISTAVPVAQIDPTDKDKALTPPSGHLDDDPVANQINAAKAAYDKAMGDFKADVRKWFDQEDDAARKLESGVTEKVKQVANEKKEFDEKGILPQRAPQTLKGDRLEKATDALVKAYTAASDEYLRKKKDDKAVALQKELEEFKSSNLVIDPPKPKGETPSTKDDIGKVEGKLKPLAVPFNEEEAKQARTVWAKYLMVEETLSMDLGKGVKLDMVLIPPGTFMMGSPKSEGGAEGEQHEVELSKPYYLAKTELSQEQYEALGFTNPSHFKGATLPVEMVNWNDAQAWLKKANETVSIPGILKDKGYRLRLPSEAQWEYACRAGTTTAFHFGDVLNGEQANCNGTMPHGTDRKGPYLEKTTPVGSDLYKPNAFGLHEMHGNVWEWCEDYFGKYTDLKTFKDPIQTAKQSEESRVIRGGWWGYSAGYSRSCQRDRLPTVDRKLRPGGRFFNFGFRVCLRQE